MSKKYTKYTNEWFNHLKTIIPQTEKVDNQDKSLVDKLKDERAQLQTDYDHKTTQIQKHESSALQEQKKLDNQTLYNDFVGSTGYNWNTKIQTWLSGQNDNLCAGTVPANELGNGSSPVNIDITEEEATALLTRAVKAFERIQGDFHTKSNGSSVSNELCRIQTQARHMVLNKSFGRDGWDLGHNYTIQGKNNFKVNKIDWNDVVAIVNVIDSSDWTKDLDQTGFSEVSWKTYGKGDKYTTDELKNLVGDITLTKDYYKTGIKNTGTLSSPKWKLSDPVITLKMKTVRDWAKLVKVLNTSAITKITTNQVSNNSEWNVLLGHLKDLKDDETFEVSGNSYKIDKIDETKVKVWKDIYTNQAAQVGLERNKVSSDITVKESELQTLITERIKKLRTSLAGHNIEKGFKDKTKETPAGTDNRKTANDLITIYKILKDIRFLENDDEEAPSTDSTNGSKENTAYDEIKLLLTDYDTSNVKLFSNLDGATEAAKIKKIKETTNDLETYKSDYEKWGKLIKFSDKQKAELAAIKTGLGESPDNTDNIQTYRDKLKNFDPELATKFTPELMTKWQSEEANKFKTSSTLEDLLKSVKKERTENGKEYEEFFNEIKKGEKGYSEAKRIDTWGKLLVKEPKVVITVIKRYEYDNRQNDNEKDLDSKIQWERRIKKAYGKETNHTLTDAEINTAVYEVAIDKKQLSTKALDANLNEYQTDQREESKGGFKEHMAKYWGWYVAGGIGIAVIGGVIIYFRDQIKSWWEPEKEGEIESSDNE